MRRLSEHYSWVEHEYDLAWTIAVIADRRAAEVLAAYGSTAEHGELTVRAALVERAEHFDDYGLLQVLDVRGAVVAIEPNGWTGTAPALAERLSVDGGHFFAVYWSPSGCQIVEARDGRLTGRFDPTFIGSAAGANDLLPGWVEPEDFPLAHVEASSLAALERRTGVAVDRSWIDKPLTTYRLPPAGGRSAE
ncbi:DUF6461 domain-containing protein [Labedaea rhizosphaerae]|uniref:Uncharacterized protein n=1 Tax=Labedaea rhizosphaerae TaxID=598644 RepID=A0A4R6SJN8_LABRH|nr:DUF6461 domain-containing protein [Labedaea rhizosphaerae]TDQ04107.1 hypothetical protein EV186_10148 [Labedaea rhizosphaerae]